MHFWIDKRSQGCGFNGRYQVPPSLACGRNPRSFCGSFYPKPMVTPVHRFQSIESVANNSVRYARQPGFQHPRLQCPSSSSVHYNVHSSNFRIPPVQARSIELLGHSQTPRQIQASLTAAKLRCSVWIIFFVTMTFVLAGVKYYFHGLNIGVEVLVFCALIMITFAVGGFISLCETLSSNAPASPPNAERSLNVEPTIEEMAPTQSTTTAPSISPQELPPPPYHIAIMLTPQNNDLEAIQVIRDSPPPTYDKAVT